MAFYRWKVGYHGGAYIDISDGLFSVLCFLPDACRDVAQQFFYYYYFSFVNFCLKKACLLLHVVLLPESQAVELLQGHAEHLVEVLRR